MRNEPRISWTWGQLDMGHEETESCQRRSMGWSPGPDGRIRDNFCFPTPGPATSATASVNLTPAWTTDPTSHSANIHTNNKTAQQETWSPSRMRKTKWLVQCQAL